MLLSVLLGSGVQVFYMTLVTLGKFLDVVLSFSVDIENSLKLYKIPQHLLAWDSFHLQIEAL